MNYKLETLLPNVAKTCGEGPHWKSIDQTLLFVDIENKKCCKWDSRNKSVESRSCDDTVSFIIPTTKNDNYVIGLGQDIAQLDWTDGKVTRLTDACAYKDFYKQTRFNDAKCDVNGILWAGTMGLTENAQVQKLGNFYKMDKNCQISFKVPNAGISNGIAWTSDNTKMFYIDSTPRALYCFDYDSNTSELSNQKTLITFPEGQGNPDGMTIDVNNNLWIALYGGSRIIHFNPETREIMSTINFPTSNITSCCFGGPNFDELFVTSSANNVNDQLAGSVFRVTNCGVKGTENYSFKYL